MLRSCSAGMTSPRGDVISLGEGRLPTFLGERGRSPYADFRPLSSVPSGATLVRRRTSLPAFWFLRNIRVSTIVFL